MGVVPFAAQALTQQPLHAPMASALDEDLLMLNLSSVLSRTEFTSVKVVAEIVPQPFFFGAFQVIHLSRHTQSPYSLKNPEKTKFFRGFCLSIIEPYNDHPTAIYCSGKYYIQRILF